MRPPAHRVATFPSVRLPAPVGMAPVEIVLIAQLGHGAGSALHADIAARQREHEHFIDALDEPSARIGNMELAANDPSTLYTFTVGQRGHPFHRHAGHRMFTAISGSGGSKLRFSTASTQDLEQDPTSFFRALRCVDIPPDCLFTVRMGGKTWHQFTPLNENSKHPALFALSCHTNELGGDLPDLVRAQVVQGEASIPSLTELLPESVAMLLKATPWAKREVPTTRLAIDAAPASFLSRLCLHVRGTLGGLRAHRIFLQKKGGFAVSSGGRLSVTCHDEPAANSLLQEQFRDGFQHQDCFTIELGEIESSKLSAAILLGRLMDGFIDNAPPGVTRLMTIRNALVRPFGLRTSPLGCPVSSLLSPPSGQLFLGRHPVRAQSISKDGQHAQVILGANDKHLRFRSCVGVCIDAKGRIEVTLATRVRCINLFGRIYMALIASTHRRYVSPAMLRMAAEHAFPETARR